MKKAARKFKILAQDNTLVDEFEAKESFKTLVAIKHSNIKFYNFTLGEIYFWCDTFKGKIVEVK